MLSTEPMIDAFTTLVSPAERAKTVIKNGNNKLGVTEGCVEDVPDLGACVVAYALGRLPEYTG